MLLLGLDQRGLERNAQFSNRQCKVERHMALISSWHRCPRLPTAIVLRGLIDGKYQLLHREGRLDTMALAVRQREAKNLILLDIERDQVMPYAE